MSTTKNKKYSIRTACPEYLSQVLRLNSAEVGWKLTLCFACRPSVVLTGRETGVVDTWDWSYQVKEAVAFNKISSLPVTCIKV